MDALSMLDITLNSYIEISLYMLEVLSYQEIANNLNISVSAVVQRIRKFTLNSMYTPEGCRLIFC